MHSIDAAYCNRFRTCHGLCVCVCVCGVCVGHMHESCKNGQTDRDAIWRNHVLDGVHVPQVEGAILVVVCPIEKNCESDAV